jgi:hypothetical protein
MGFISRELIPRVKVTLPQYMGGANPTVYLGMPPLQIGGVKNSVATHIRGISGGGVGVVEEPVRTTDIKGRTKRRNIGANVVANKAKRGRTTSNNTQSVQKKAKKKGRSSMVRKPQKRVNGRFVK